MSRDLEGKTFMVTGASSGVGLVTARELAARGGYVVLAVRSASKATSLVEELRANGGACEVLSIDVSDLSSVRAAADQYLASGRALDVLVNNAGMAGQRGLSKDGFELTFATNHLGHFLLTEKLMPLLKASAQGRLVNVSSEAHYRPKTLDWEALRRPTVSVSGMDEYGVSKLCNVLHAAELARRLTGTKVTTYSLHPGVVATDVWRKVPSPIAWVMKRFMLTPEQGARTQLRCAADPALSTETGLYYDSERVKEPSRLAKDPALAKELWDRSAEWVSGFLH